MRLAGPWEKGAEDLVAEAADRLLARVAQERFGMPNPAKNRELAVHGKGGVRRKANQT